MKPLIGITAGYDENKGETITCPLSYVNAVIKAGGKPLIIPVMPESLLVDIISVLDGLLLPGGVDLDPRHYMERPSPKLGALNPRLDSLELGLARNALEVGLPLLGICRGAQVGAVAAGGTLVQDIPSQVGGAMKHFQNAPRWYGTHEVILSEDSLFQRVFETRRLIVNSFHHQSIKLPGEGFSITARALDGVCEGAESATGFRMLIQWHPECMLEEDRIFLRPFEALIKAAKGLEV